MLYVSLGAWLSQRSQHFQGLRRAQNKADTNGAVSDSSSRKSDPTANPITRRPGPGRGRPRKQPPVPITGALPEQGQESETTPGEPGTLPEGIPAQGETPPEAGAGAAEPLALDASGDDLDEPAIKRQRLDDGADQSALEDEAVLSALAAHSNSASVDHYAQE